MKTVKDIKNDWGYKFVSSKNDRASIVEYFEKPELGAFGGFFIKLNESGNSYDGIYGIYGSNPDLKKEAIPVVVDGSFIFEAMTDNANRGNQFEVGEMVKINLTLVESTTSVYAKQIRNIVRKNKGFAVVVGVDGNQIKIAESVNQGKATGGIIINAEAIEKINGIKSACEIYEDKDVVADWTQKLNESKKVDTTDYTEVPEEAMELNLFPKK